MNLFYRFVLSKNSLARRIKKLLKRFAAKLLNVGSLLCSCLQTQQISDNKNASRKSGGAAT
ncbi:hypothetical protein BCY91_11795 [Pelobium manganitolerans]|uniref:Uncharacterized protein n=1 Tax=Pelobium manganitolerans TaxID=1842495 RepID=A0A419S1H2_9SPHI|nr:hypothetical protein BCY91_11795 [Pelobium manganitolerans]